MSDRSGNPFWPADPPASGETSADEPSGEEHVAQPPVLRGRPDPRSRPSDPAGTQPKIDERTLLPAEPMPQLEAPRSAGQALVPAGDGGSQALDRPLARAESEHAPRFQFLLGALGALAVSAIAIAILIVARPGPTPGPIWSTWHPTSSGGDPLTQIANHVGSEYRLDNGDQLVGVSGGPLEVQGLAVTVALRTPGASGANVSLLNGNGVLYKLCGLGPSCSIAEGKPSTQRHLLLRREALELALYTFKYINGVNDVVVFMPPPPPSAKSAASPSSTAAAPSPANSQALFFRTGDLRPELAQPLDDTFPGATPSVSTVTSSPNGALVNNITSRTLYTYSLTQDQSASVFLVLQPVFVGG